MKTRNTPVLREIIEVLSTELDDAPYALEAPKNCFHDRLLVDIGNLNTISTVAEQLQLHITADVLCGLGSHFKYFC